MIAMMFMIFIQVCRDYSSMFTFHPLTLILSLDPNVHLTSGTVAQQFEKHHKR